MLAETDHLLQLRDCLRWMISDATLLADKPWISGTYQHFVEQLKLAQFQCEQIVWDRADGRWSMLPILFADVHKKCGDWVRGRPVFGEESGEFRGRVFPERGRFKVFAEMLRGLERYVDELQNKATGRVGPMIAKPLRAERTHSRPVGWRGRVSQGGVLIPDEVAA